VVQALVKPTDIILVDRDCHKSHHYGMVLAGAHVCYLDSYPLNEYSMYGAVPLKEIKRKLLMYRKSGQLHRVKLLLLTNCTFDGVVYNVERVMEECLAIKPDLIFLWDEAWFAFAGFTPTYRRRTAMATAKRLKARYRSEEYASEYNGYQKRIAKLDDEALISERLMPDPEKVRIRAYATQSTHKSLTSLRQGSMIHINDQDFRHKVQEPFQEAFMTHTSTSPNYQILASLDIGRRQVELEGFEMVQKQAGDGDS
jgi:arginine decarboxylase